MTQDNELESFVENELDDLSIEDHAFWGPMIEGRANALFNIVEYIKEHYAKID